MRKKFDDGSFVELKIGSPGNIALILGAKKKENNLKMEINACEISISDFADLIDDLGIDIKKTANKPKVEQSKT